MIDTLEIGGKAVRVHFDSKKIAVNAQSAANGNAKRRQAAYTTQTRIRPGNNGGYWLYIRKIEKDPATWGEQSRAKRKQTS